MANKNLIDPNVFTNTNDYLNQQMPKYEDMHIFAELTSHGRERSVIIQSNDVMARLDDRFVKMNFGDKNKTYNLLGSNAENNFTTNWHDGSTDKSNLEGFGIESLKITVNSSFIPQVDIKFVDYRGRTFFNNDNSPYRMLFDFPPPIFKLTVKGYYGLGLTYLLHLVKYSTEFKSDNGFFYIEAQFVALTFAPLADIPFRYIIQFAMLDGQNLDPTKTTIPKNTLELILKIKTLYTNLQKQVSSLDKKTILDTIVNNGQNVQDAYDYIQHIRNDNDINTDAIIFKLGENNEIEKIENISSFQEDIKSYQVVGEPSRTYKKLCVGFNYNSGATYQFQRIEYFNRLLKYQERLFYLLQQAGTGITIDQIPITTQNNDLIINIPSLLYAGVYIYLDLTQAFIKLNLKKQNDINSVKSINRELTTKINQMVYAELGMLPTIYNVFKIILDDVDNFFTKLNECSINAQKHHNIYKNLIINDGSFKDKLDNTDLYSFPLVINKQNNTRIAPIELSAKLGEGFPELELINKFINSFIKTQNSIERLNQKDTKDANGNNIWIPFTPRDSSLNLSSINNNPFYYDNIMIDYLKTSINRFYVYKDVIFKDYKSDSSLKIYAEGEANNLVNALLSDDKSTDNIKNNVTYWNSNIDNLYSFIESNLSNLYSISGGTINLGNEYYCVSKTDDKYIGGFAITTQTISLRKTDNEPKTSFDSLLDKTPFIYSNSKSLKSFFDTKISSDNLLYIKDVGEVQDNKSRYFEKGASTAFNTASENRNIAYIEGNAGFVSESKQVQELDICITFADQIINNKQLYVSAPTNELKMLLLVSCFGKVASPFNNISSNINDLFIIPSVIQIPKFVYKYVSILSHYTMGNITGLNDLENYLLYGSGNTLTSDGVSILADLYDTKNTLSIVDNDLFINQYQKNDIDHEFNLLNIEMLEIINNPNITRDQVINKLKQSINFKSFLFDKVNFLNFDDQTFKLVNKSTKGNSALEYISIKSMINNDKINLDLFFKTFVTKLNTLIIDKKKANDDKKVASKKIGGDVDIINQTYYSFKTINDKWLTDISTKDNNTGGYPFNLKGKKLIDSFAFVDRTMNPIGDTMINPEILSQMMDNPDINVFSVLSSLLSLNGFEFFPLQNFMYDGKNKWQDNFFKIDNNTIMESTQNFTCMYIGGSASYPTGLEQYGYYKEDGILDIDNTDLFEFNDTKDYSVNGKDHSSLSESDKIQVTQNTNFPWGKIKGFRVRFGEQNQSMFNEYKIDSKEYPETNESIQILSRLAGDNTMQEPTPKAQNLYNLYENRAYKATVNGLGNVLIQPSQYFQLENIPMFNGAYMILGVEHNIINNRMTTSFTGTKILKYPVPRVLNAATVFGFGGGDSNNTATGDIPNYDGNINDGSDTYSAIPDTIDGSIITDKLKKISIDPVPSNSLIKLTNVTGRRTLKGFNEDHKGIDIPVNINTNIFSVADGIIYKIDTDKTYDGGYGNYIVIDHGVGYFNNNDHLYSLYGHLNSLSIVKNASNKSFQKNDIVSAGQQIGNSGSSGHSTGPHLHFGLYQKIPINKDYAINPKLFFNDNTKLRILINNYGRNK